MENLKKLVVSPEYPNGILVDLTQDEIAQRKIDEQNAIAEQQARVAKQKATEDAKASGLAKLQALGLSVEEIKAIL